MGTAVHGREIKVLKTQKQVGEETVELYGIIYFKLVFGVNDCFCSFGLCYEELKTEFGIWPIYIRIHIIEKLSE